MNSTKYTPGRDTIGLAARLKMADELESRRPLDRMLDDADAIDASKVRVYATTEPRDDWENWPLVRGGQGSVPSEVKSTAAATGLTLMLMLIGAALVSLAFEYRWITVAFGVLVIIVAIVTAMAMPAPAYVVNTDRPQGQPPLDARG